MQETRTAIAKYSQPLVRVDSNRNYQVIIPSHSEVIFVHVPKRRTTEVNQSQNFGDPRYAGVSSDLVTYLPGFEGTSD